MIQILTCDLEKIDQARNIFISYFTHLYKNIPSDILGIENLPRYLKEVFDRTEIALREGEIQGFMAYIDEEPAGFATCGLLEDPKMLLVRTMPIQYKEMEIRHAFLSHFCQQFLTAESIVMMVRKANVIHASLCLQAGFIKDDDVFNQSTYLKATYSSKWYDPYVLKDNQ